MGPELYREIYKRLRIELTCDKVGQGERGTSGPLTRVGSDSGNDSTQPLESPRHRGLTPIKRITGV
jgi:hypothetical protein